MEIDSISCDVLSLIFSYIGLKSLCNVRLVCRSFRRAVIQTLRSLPRWNISVHVNDVHSMGVQLGIVSMGLKDSTSDNLWAMTLGVKVGKGMTTLHGLMRY